MTDTVMQFPCEFSLKVFGKVDSEIEPIIIASLRLNGVDAEHVKITSRPSSGGKYNAFTATFTAVSQEQLDSIYRNLSGHAQIIMVL